MPFSEDQLNAINILCKRLEPRTYESIQDYSKENDLRTGVVLGIKNKRREYICLFMNFKPLNRTKSAILQAMIKRLTFETYITYPSTDIIRIGWKSK